MEDKGIKITPEMIEKMKAAKSPKELMELGKGFGIELDEKAAEKWFAKLNSGELAAKELSSVNTVGGCSKVKCPKCGSDDYSQIYIPNVGVHCHCNHCGYDAWYY
ncbi:MAG TPA: hypothetical protein HA262_13830 [Methanosarcina sp.]|jgi:hypothetical protein|nr:hypothetical protein [Methanosarcina sp.]